MNQLIFTCAQLHTEHIAQGDPFEKGSSRPLDFGHWAAHKLEYLSNYKLLHGEAVAIGILVDSCYSHYLGYLTAEDLERILNCFKNLGFDLTCSELFDPEDKNSINPALIQGLEEFREHLGGELTIVLLQEIGQGQEVHQMQVPLLNQAVQKMLFSEKQEDL